MRTRRKRSLLDSLPLVLVGAVLVITTGPAWGQIFDDDYTHKESTDISAELGLYSSRVYRGQNLYKGSSLQPKLSGSVQTEFGTLYAKAAAHFAIGGSVDSATGGPFSATDSEGNEVEVKNATRSFDDFSFDVGYGYSFGIINAALGHRWILDSEDVAPLDDTREYYGRVDADMIGNPYLLVARDYDQLKGTYYEAGVVEALPIGPESNKTYIVPSFTIGASSNLNDGEQPVYQDSGLTHLEFGLKGIVPVAAKVNLEPELHLQHGIDDAATDDIWFGLNFVSDLNGS